MIHTQYTRIYIYIHTIKVYMMKSYSLEYKTRIYIFINAPPLVEWHPIRGIYYILIGCSRVLLPVS